MSDVTLEGLRKLWAQGASMTNKKLTKKGRSAAAKKGWINRRKNSQ